jgi:phenylacetate-coenzyme A ligase PaaK-like adenylate-forming protein
MPVLRFRTGDLKQKGSRDGKLILPRGVFGRTDSMVKIKGVKVYPRELLFLLAATPGLNRPLRPAREAFRPIGESQCPLVRKQG